jgi:hypothetical protein
MSGPITYIPGQGRLAADEYTYLSHVDGYSDRHNADDIDLNPSRVVDSITCTTVGAALYALIGESAANFTAAGDLSGNASTQTVIGIYNNPVSAITPSTGDVLLFTSGAWTPSPISPAPPSGTAGGNLSGTYPNPVVAAIHGSSVPAGGSLTTGNTLYASGSSSLSYGALNLAGGAGYVSGTLPSANQVAQTMGGDVSGTTTSATVIKLQGHAISATAPTSNQVLQYVGSTWTPATLSFNALSGDVTGTAGANTVISLTGTAGSVITQTSIIPAANNTLTLGSSSKRWEYLYMGNSIVWPSTYISSTIGNVGMDLTNNSGRPHAYIDGYDHGLSAWRAYFGDGSDGEEACDGSSPVNGMGLIGDVYTLTRDCYFTNLTISSSADVLLDGYRLFVNGLLVIGSGCSVGVPGNNATNNTGVPGAATMIGSVLGGSAGGAGDTSTGANGTSSIDALGGSGGAGGAGGGSDGYGGIVTHHTVNLGSIRHAPEALLGAIYSCSAGVWTPISGGCGGGGGAGASGTTGGGGGGGGGVSIIAARIVTGAGSISVVGGAGGNSSGSGTGNGGGGGGGGLSILVFGDKSGFTGSVLTSGGAAGTGINAGVTGTVGSSGTSILIPA